MTERKTIMILEDKRYLADDLADRLSDYDLMGPFPTGEEALEAIEDGLPDIGVFDIELKGELNGIDVAERINKRARIPIIYLTKIQDDQSIYTRITSAEFPVFFVSKPVSNTELKINLINAFSALRESSSDGTERQEVPMDVLNDRVLLRNTDGVYSVHVEDFIFVEADGDTTRVFCVTHKYPIVVSTHLKDFLEKIERLSKNILRVNRSNAVNIRKIVQIKDEPKSITAKKTLILEGTEEKLTLSLKYKKDVLARFKMI